ncbi:hypothetical protein Slala04_69820 [Streptomyces lavendulae subsp. lavendulae]|nr:hypothetical protein Slala04_69820 [Streptomyces lavendulae subsp. lavendulae]
MGLVAPGEGVVPGAGHVDGAAARGSMVPLYSPVPLIDRFTCLWPDAFPLVVKVDAPGSAVRESFSTREAGWPGKASGDRQPGGPKPVASVMAMAMAVSGVYGGSRQPGSGLEGANKASGRRPAMGAGLSMRPYRPPHGLCRGAGFRPVWGPQSAAVGDPFRRRLVWWVGAVGVQAGFEPASSL